MKQLLQEALSALEIVMCAYTRNDQVNNAVKNLRAAVKILEKCAGSDTPIQLRRRTLIRNLRKLSDEVSPGFVALQIDEAVDILEEDAIRHTETAIDTPDLTDAEILQVFETCHAGRIYPQDWVCGPTVMRLVEGRAVLAAQKAKR